MSCHRLARSSHILLIVFAGLVACRSRPATETLAHAGPVSFNLSAITGATQPQLFSEVKQASMLPQAVLHQFPGGIADRGEPFNTTDVNLQGLPNRMLSAAAVSKQYCIVSYWHGGFALTFQTSIFELSDNGARLIWFSPSQGGLNFRDLKEMVESGRMHNDLDKRYL